eukprot:1195676-Rhodomonas_salina.1
MPLSRSRSAHSPEPDSHLTTQRGARREESSHGRVHAGSSHHTPALTSPQHSAGSKPIASLLTLLCVTFAHRPL